MSSVTTMKIVVSRRRPKHPPSLIVSGDESGLSRVQCL
jgi:hypothetical protein